MLDGSIVRYREREGEEPFIAIVQGEWPDGSLQLFVLHHQASANVRAARRDQCEVVLGADMIRTVIVEAIGALNDKINFLLERVKDVEGDEDKPWPSSSSVSTSRGRRQPSNASATS